MQFKLLSIATAVLAASSAQAQLSANDVVKNIGEITELSSSTADIAKQIDSPISVFTTAPRLVDNLKQIITAVGKDIIAMTTAGGSTDFNKDDQHDICDAFRTFVKVHQELLSIIIGKGGILTGTPFTAPLAFVLSLLEKGVDALAFGIIGTVPTCSTGAKKDLKDLDDSLKEAITRFT
ncbi:hypothetical protein EDB80DRAFT_711444 [Ilyonectria destructans]|nr:hypothetical protein EDB80DRAFT_711444 [Ilyonectria destructans]